MHPILACSDAATMAFVFNNARTVLVRHGFHALTHDFPTEIRDLLAARRPHVQLAVANYDVNRDLGLKLEIGELAVYAGGKFVGKLDPDDPKSERYDRIYDRKKAAAHQARLEKMVLELIDRATARTPAAQVSSNDDPFAVLGVSESASLLEVEAVRKRLVLEVHPDRAVNLGPRGLKLLEEDTKRINGAVDAIRRLRSAGKR